MKNEKPILYNAEMVKALLEGRKTMTRRPMKVQPEPWWSPHQYYHLRNPDEMWVGDINGMKSYKCPFGKVGDRLGAIEDSEYIRKFRHDMPEVFAEEWRCHVFQWDEIVSIRVERVQEISYEDAYDEGVRFSVLDCLDHFMGFKRGNPVKVFEMGWNSIYKNWNDSPWVWVVEFRFTEAGAK